jgi:hypothetical protein
MTNRLPAAFSIAAAVAAAAVVSPAAPSARQAPGSSLQPAIVTRAKAVLRVDGLRFKDANGNGRLDPYEDWRLGAEARARRALRRSGYPVTRAGEGGLERGIVGSRGRLVETRPPEALLRAGDK